MFSSTDLVHTSFTALALVAATLAYDTSSNANVAMYYVCESKELTLAAVMLTRGSRAKVQARMSSDSVIFVTVRPSTLFHWVL